MTEDQSVPEDDEDRSESPEQKRVRELHEAYHARFGEWAPVFGVFYEDEDDMLRKIEEAVKTGRAIEDQTPPGCVS